MPNNINETHAPEEKAQEIAAKLPTLALGDIASLIDSHWKPVYFGARPYLDAMYSLRNIHSAYGMDSGKSIVLYFLNNAQTWRGSVAKVVKAHLNKLCKGCA